MLLTSYYVSFKLGNFICLNVLSYSYEIMLSLPENISSSSSLVKITMDIFLEHLLSFKRSIWETFIFLEL